MSTIIGLGGEVYLPRAKGMLRDLKKLKSRSVTALAKQIEVGNYIIKVSFAGDNDNIRIMPLPGPYEFLCSDVGVITSAVTGGFPKNGFLYTDSNTAVNTDAVVRGCGVRVRGGGSPAFSNVLTPPPDGSLTWTMLPVPSGTTAAGQPMMTKFFTGDDTVMRYRGGIAWQRQKQSEYVWWHNNSSEILVTGTLGVGLGKSYQCKQPFVTAAPTGYELQSAAAGIFQNFNRGSYAYSGRGYGLAEYSGAGFWDVPPSVWTSRFNYEIGSKRAAKASWRRCAVQRVQVDTRYEYYMISADKHGSFSAYRIRDYFNDPALPGGVLDASDIPATYVKTATPSYPSWVTVPADTDDAVDHWVFTFNKDGTKASATPFERVESWAWIGCENIVYSVGTTLSFDPRVSVPGEYGNGNIYRYPSFWVRWAVESLLAGGVTPQYTVTRQRVYQETGNLPHGKTAVNMQGSYYYTFYGRINTGDSSADSNGIMPGVDPANLEPAFICKPGFVELGFTISPSSGDPDVFTFTVDVLDSESYESNKRFYVDVGYYAQDKRTAAFADMPAEDTLLTAEIEVWCASPSTVVAEANNPGGRAHCVGDGNSAGSTTFYVPYADTYNYTKADEPNCEGVWISNYVGDVEIQYVVRNRATQAIVKRFSLANNMKWASAYMSKAISTTPGHIGSLMFADLRKLNFVTGTFSTAASYYADWNWMGPRYELRVNGESTRTVSYAEEGTHAFDVIDDPMVTMAVDPSGYTKLPGSSAYVPGGAGGTGGAPNSFLLAVQLWVANACIGSDLSRNISTHPSGHWACYMATNGDGRVWNNVRSTEAQEAFDIIKYVNGTTVTHKGAFNTAFGQARDYSTYQGLGESGGFCTFGTWYGLKTLRGPVTS